MRALIAGLALALAAPALGQDAPPWRSVSEQTGEIRDLEGLATLAGDFPDSASVRLRLLRAELQAGDADAIVRSLAWLAARGHVFSAAAQAQIREIMGDDYSKALDELLIPQAPVIEASEAIALVPAEAGLVESVLAPEGEDLLIVTSVTDRAIHILANDAWARFPIPGASDLSGIVSEPDASMGWVASSNLDGSEDEEPLFHGLMGLRGDFSDPVLIPAPDGVAVSDITIGRDATIYASDPIGGGVYRKPAGAATMETLVDRGTFRSPQGLALSEDGGRLYVSDYRYGVAIVDLVTREVTRLASDVPVVLDGVDGLWMHEQELIAVQNGTSPMRISAFRLSDDGLRISSVRVLEQAHPEWTEPLGGSIRGEALIYVGTGQWDRFVAGERAADKSAIPTQIRSLRLNP